MSKNVWKEVMKYYNEKSIKKLYNLEEIKLPLKRLLKEPKIIKVNVHNKHGWTPLHHAA